MLNTRHHKTKGKPNLFRNSKCGPYFGNEANYNKMVWEKVKTDIAPIWENYCICFSLGFSNCFFNFCKFPMEKIALFQSSFSPFATMCCWED